MGITILTVGKKNSSEYSDMIDEYMKRISSFISIRMKFIKDSGNLKEDRESAVKQESERILKEVCKEKFVILLDRKGESIDSERFSDLFNNNNICFVIGGIYGVDERVKKELQE